MAKGLYKRGNLYWICYADGFGKIVRESSHSSKFKDAEALLAERRNRVREGKEPEPVKKIPNYNFSHLAGEYIKWCERQRSFKSKKDFILQLTEVFGNVPLRCINTKLLEHFQSERLLQGKKKVKINEHEWVVLPNKPATINRLIATLKHMFTKAVEWDMVGEETLKRIRKVKLLEENNKRLRYLSKEECQNLISNCQGNTEAIVITALNTGMRKGEILNLEWEKHVDLKHGFITLDVTKNGERREIPINDTVRGVLQGLTRRLDIPYVFYDSATSKPYGDIKRSFNTALRRAGIRDFHFHDLRHTFSSHLVMAGVDLTTVSRLLGHKTLTMTLRYAHLAPSHMVKAVDILDSTLTGKSTAQKLHNLRQIR
jgi:integrase